MRGGKWSTLLCMHFASLAPHLPHTIGALRAKWHHSPLTSSDSPRTVLRLFAHSPALCAATSKCSWRGATQLLCSMHSRLEGFAPNKTGSSGPWALTATVLPGTAYLSRCLVSLWVNSFEQRCSTGL